MASCVHCGLGRIQTRALSERDLSALGIPVRVAQGAHVAFCAECGQEEIFVENMSELLAAAACSLTLVPYKLNGDEIKFCRKAIGLSGKDLARKMGVQPETVSRWENEKQVILDPLERVFRLLVAGELRNKAPKVLSGEFWLNILSVELSPVRAERDIPTLVYSDDPSAVCGTEHATSRARGGYGPLLAACG